MPRKAKKIKNFVLDTNILLTSPTAILGFDDNNVWITGTVLQELDSKKRLMNEIGFNARTVIKQINHYRESGDLTNGVPLENGGHLFVEPNGVKIEYLPSGFSLDNPDNRILASVKHLMLQGKGDFIIITNDASMQINASICGIAVESYKNDHYISDEGYKGWTNLKVDYKYIDALYKVGYISVDIKELDYEFVENEFFILTAGNTSALAIYRNGEFKLVDKKNAYGVTPRNAAQTFALYALLAPVDEIPFVILKGEAGSAKTFLSLAAGLENVDCSSAVSKNYKHEGYNKVLISRNNITSDDDFGYLPGDIDDKMGPLLAPFYDNLETLIRNNDNSLSNEDIQLQIDDLFESGLIKVCPLAYMRGRSIYNSYLIVDEAQNATKTQMRDIVTRAGEGTKVVICGDPKQIDNHMLDKYNNGLVFAADRFKGSPLCAQLTFDKEECVRSSLATEALKRMEV